MPITDTPLRYPGGKTKLYRTVCTLINSNRDSEHCIYVEPFAGGSGLALRLLFKNDVDYLVLNDIDYGIYSFWNSCLNHTDELCQMIYDCDITINNWNIQKTIYNSQQAFSELQVGFATFFLNRCNVSGVIKGGVIGGFEQTGKYKIDARFNKNELIAKIIKIGQNRDRIEFHNMDADDFLKAYLSNFSQEEIFLNIDPPYVKKGSMLYKNSFNPTDHILLANTIQKLNCKWIVTYDKCSFIDSLYKNYRHEVIELKYSAGKTKSGNEYIIYGDSIYIPTEEQKISSL